MFYKIKVQDHVRVQPKHFSLPVTESVLKSVREKYSGHVDENLGIVVDVLGIHEIGEGVIISGDGATYYDSTFDVISYKPEMHETVSGHIKDIADFGAFITLGPLDGMIHISQAMDDFVSFSKEKLLSGKDSKRVLKVGDICRARIIAVSFNDQANPKIGLTMRQQGLGKVEWVVEDRAKKAEKPEKAEKDTKEKK